MPNHITNEIRVIGGTNKQRLDFIRVITNKKGLIDFNTICRRPKSIEMEENNHIRRMASAMAGETVYDYMFGELKTPEQVELAMRESGMTRKEICKIKEQALMRLENYRRYGYYSWFDWSRANWGTKWNAYNIEMPVKRIPTRIKYGHNFRHTHVRAYAKRIYKKRLARHAATGGELVIRFETAWSMPKPIYQAMARKFPHLEFVIRYADEDFGNNCGFILLRNGKWEYDYIAPANNKQSSEEKIKWRKFAFELCCPGITPQEYGLNEEYEYAGY
ncbi:hypothetical protein JDS23_21215 [Escherichia coli]|nr:hypothetical protein [Escherichia coli]